MGKMFYKDAYIVLFIYDITDKSSFEDLKNIWYDEVTKSGEKRPIFAVVGNKNDMYLNEEVSEDEGRKYAGDIDAIFTLVSAKTGDCINSLFENVLKKYLKPDFVSKINEENSKNKDSKRIENIIINDNRKNKKNKCNC